MAALDDFPILTGDNVIGVGADAFLTVSYTHLDVYKRQGRCDQKLSCDFSDIAYLIHHIILLKTQFVPVLDVFFNVKFILFVIIG